MKFLIIIIIIINAVIIINVVVRDPRFAGSNSVEVDGFFENVKILCTSPTGGTLSRGFRV